MPELAFYWPVMIFVMPTLPLLIAFMVTTVLGVSKVSMLFSLLILLISVVAYLLQSYLQQMEDLHKKQLAILDNAREMEIALKLHNQELIEKQDNDIQIATLNERHRIAREMHDHAGHLLSRALLQIGAFMAISSENQSLSPIRETVSDAMDSLRNSVHNLFDTSIDLTLQLNQIAKDFTFCTINMNLNYTDDPSTRVKLALIAIFKESLSNIMRHSNATRVEVVFMEHPDFYQWVISDNGSTARGKDFSTHSSTHHGMGLGNIARRIETLGGHMIIKTANGFTLFMTIPRETP